MNTLFAVISISILPFTSIIGPNTGEPVRWPITGAAIDYRINTANEPFAGCSTNVRNALQQWNNVTSSNFAWAFDAAATGNTGFSYNFQNTISYNNGSLGAGVLAAAVPFTPAPSANPPNPYPFGGQMWERIEDMDISFASGTNFGPNATLGGAQFSIEAVALHEAGHGLGLGHPDQVGQSVTAVMNSAIGPGDTTKATPALDDAQGITAIYDNGLPLVYPGYTVDTDFGYAPLTVNVSDASINATSWSWTFGDGGTSTVQDPTHTYQNVGTFTINQTVNGTVAGSPTQVQAVAMPFVDFTVDTPTGPRPLTVRFTNNSSGTIYGYTWDFGDSVLSNDTDPVHEYLYDGTYNVTLTVTGVAGDVQEVKQGLIVVEGGSGGSDPKNPFEQFLEDMGCSCTVAPGRTVPASSVALALFALALIVTRRRPR